MFLQVTPKIPFILFLLKVVEAIGRENVKLNEKQLEELIILLEKEEIIEAEEKIEKAIAKSIKEAEEAKKVAEQMQVNESSSKQQKVTSTIYTEDLKDCAKVIKENALNLDEIDKKNVLKTEPAANTKQESVLLEAAEKQKDKILPKTDIMPPTTPPPSTLPPNTKTNQVNTKDKMI
ncbi:mitochondrial proton/calcium exchanger protein-like [Lucilia cuprina]|uniref:mitochondrial proton/calcium exchanger protein-like n=1 Tax=Lucilia cuprina TaxID=7375 RepID=UPI001F059544|nr:mitochondrial proton/calcium exchanger protein-like [Lucilia cuprina]